MAQAVASSPTKSTAFPTPPGLEQPDLAVNGAGIHAETADEVKAAALQSVEEKLNQLGANCSRQAIIEAIREVVLQDVDLKVAEKVEELWQKGKQMLTQIQQKHKEKTNKLTEEVTKCHEKLRGLESENERLKQVLQTLHTRFSLLGAVFSGKDTPAADAPPDATAALAENSMASPPHTQEPSDLYALGPFTPANDGTMGQGADMDCAGSVAKLPDVPAFPFPAQPSSPPAPLSLAEALGTQTPQRTPLSLVNSLTPPGASPEVARTPLGNPGIFSFTLRKADGADLGLNVSHHEHDQVLRVEGVRADGAVEAWNRQCAGSAAAEKAVISGDKIISVNNIAYDPSEMLKECRDKQLLKLTIVRGDRPLPAMPTKEQTARGEASPAAASKTTTTTTLRADASVFVPMATEAAAPQPQPEDSSVEQAGKAVADATTDGSAQPKSEGTAERV